MSHQEWMVLGAMSAAWCHTAARLWLKLGALAILFVLAPWAWWGSIAEDIDLSLWSEDWTHLSFYLASVAISFTGICLVPFLLNGWLRAILTLLFLIGFWLDQVVLGISGNHLTFDMAETLVRESDMAMGAARTFGASIIKASSVVGFLAFAFLVPPSKRQNVGYVAAILPLAAFPMFFASSQIARGKVASYPSTYSVPMELVWSALFKANAKDVSRDPVDYHGALQEKIKKIIVVIDEAARGDYLGLNNSRYDNTPALMSQAELIANYGVAVSIANCSHTSRYLMRIGLPKKEIPDLNGVADRLPTIWQYARDAGFKTVFVDTFRKFGSYHSYMNYREANQIDEFITLLDHPYYQRDISVADKLLDILKSDQKMFVYINKFGTHQPYDDSFPPDLAYDPPSSTIGRFSLSSPRREAIRDYHKALRASVDGFFEKILPALGDDTILIYTSDHGESLYEGGYDWGHCTSDSKVVAVGEGLVPLFVAARSPDLIAKFKAAAARSFNEASHFEIFPTLLELEGYPDNWVEGRYGPSLLNVPRDRKRAFLVGNFESERAVWVSVGSSVNEPPMALEEPVLGARN
jgi:glucan phosphoethanolaminetransferase (alkaline phosphatase superfamily)